MIGPDALPAWRPLLRSAREREGRSPQALRDGQHQGRGLAQSAARNLAFSACTNCGYLFAQTCTAGLAV